MDYDGTLSLHLHLENLHLENKSEIIHINLVKHADALWIFNHLARCVNTVLLKACLNRASSFS